ncbi:SURF1 family cytochrome oxidase biogenesis protein [Citricoccus sp. NR2]|uniref:SURF1 family cytochrome oxidase biogenesis protein n=1 Tax=Citricoccus sp. NR2 TaxID=3004095 RepID=UPI0022DD056B|nr:SURF1 family protein [Citricoccus sp. NR2]WBL18310.1 SURF1 family protein [Citricoccus sp. NR2]
MTLNSGTSSPNATAETTRKPKLDFRFLISGAWIGGLIFCVVFSIACAMLGQWQMDRRMQALEEINKVVRNYDAVPVPYSENADIFTDFRAERKWTPVMVRGEYLVEDSLIVRNRPHSGRPGYEVLVPFRTVEGDTLIVDRGWLPIGNSPGRPDDVPEPAEGTITIIVRALAGEPTLEDRSAPEGQVASIDLPAIADQLDYPIAESAYGLMAAESPEAEETPTQMPQPTEDEGPHLSYSMQWFTFGLMSFVVWGYMARQKAIQNREDELYGFTEEQGFISAHRMERKKATRRRGNQPTDEEIEDSMLGD